MRSRPFGVLTPEASTEKMVPPAPRLAELDRLGDDIAELATPGGGCQCIRLKTVVCASGAT